MASLGCRMTDSLMRCCQELELARISLGSMPVKVTTSFSWVTTWFSKVLLGLEEVSPLNRGP